MIKWIIVFGVFILGCRGGIPLPNFDRLKKNYPGYPNYGGSCHDNKIYVTSGPRQRHTDTSGLRLSLALNEIGGLHAIKSDEKLLDEGDIRYVPYKNQYIISDAISFGPYLENKYDTPESIKANKNPLEIMEKLKGRRGIIRVALYKKKHPDATVALWDCDHFHQTRDWTLTRHLIGVDFWEIDSNCKNN